MRRSNEAGFGRTAVELVGVDLHPRVVHAASRIIEHEGLAGIVAIHEGDALTWLAGSNSEYDVVLAEGVFEYADMARSVELARGLFAHLSPRWVPDRDRDAWRSEEGVDRVPRHASATAHPNRTGRDLPWR